MDVISFDSFYQSLRRNEARERMANAWMGMIAAQASGEDLANFLKPYEELLQVQVEGTAADFLKDMGEAF